MYLDRALQLRILETLKADYPGVEFPLDECPTNVDETHFRQNLHYLLAHGLVAGEPCLEMGLDGVPEIISAAITAKGLDFLENDGGLGAILGTVTVRFDVESVRTVLADAIERADIPVTERKTKLERLRGLGAEALRVAAFRALECAVERPDILLRLF